MNSAKLLKTSAVIAMLMAGTAAAQPDREGPPQVEDFPKFATRALAESFQIRPFAWLEASDPPLFDPFNPDGPGQQFAFYDMELSDGSGRLPKGLFATTGPFPLERSNRIYFVSPEGEVEVFREGFAGSNGIVLGGELLELNGGFLVAESVTSSVRFVNPDFEGIDTLLRFEDRSPAAVGGVKHPADFDPNTVRPTGLTVGTDIFRDGPESRDLVLYMTDYNLGDGWSKTGGKILRIPVSDGDTPEVTAAPRIVAEIPVQQFPGRPTSMTAGISSSKALRFDFQGVFTNGRPALLAATFSVPSLDLTEVPPAGRDSFFAITSAGNGQTRTKRIAGGLDGVMYPDIAPMEDTNFAPGLYIPTLGTASKLPNGGIYIATPKGETEIFIANVNATSVVFDHEGVLGTRDAMYFATFDPYQPGVIWQVSPQ